MTRETRPEPIILVVDDSVTNIDVIIGSLTHAYRISVATNGRDAVELARKARPDLILLDVMMPEMNGYEVCEKLKSDRACRDIPVIFLTALEDENDEEKGLRAGAVDYITKPFSPRLLEQRIKTHLALKDHRDNLEQMVRQRTRMLNLTQAVTIEIAGHIAEYRDPETGEHIKRTKNYVRVLAGAMRENARLPEHFLDDHYIDLLVKSAPLHDIGKVGIPDTILLKPGKLTPDEFEQMKRHTVYGRDIIASSEKNLGTESFLSVAREIAHTHHEKWDGSGYPLGLKKHDIPISGRLMALADVYDALISKRVYKPAFSHEKAVAVIRQSRGSHFDPDMVDFFLGIQDRFQLIAARYADPVTPSADRSASLSFMGPDRSDDDTDNE